MNSQLRHPSLATLPAHAGAGEELLKRLCDDTNALLTDGTARFSRHGLYYDTRYALWSGQNDEGTKDTGDDFPWPGASDTRVRLADAIIRKRKRLRKAAFWGKRLKAKALRSVNVGAAVLVNTLLKWTLYTQCLPMVKRELELCWSYQDTYGAGVMGCFWRQRTRLEPITLDLEQFAAEAAESEDPQQGLAFIRMLHDPLQDPATIEGMKQKFPDNSDAELQRFIAKLRKEGSAEIRTAYVCENQPRWLALRPGIDVFFDAALDDLQEAPLIVCRELLTEADLRERETSEGWSGEFIEEALKHRGKTGIDGAIDPLLMTARSRDGYRSVMGEDTDGRIEILRAFYLVSEKESTGLYQTVFHRDVKHVAALHELHSYDHGRMPFFAWTAETEERAILESRGIPEICLTWQSEAKNDRDFFQDRNSLEVLPTLMVPRGLAGQVILGPAQQVERRRTETYEFLTPPAVSAAATRSGEERAKEIADYFGFAHAQGDPEMTMLAKQEIANDTLTNCVPLIAQTWQLMQQYLTDEEVQSVAGPLARGVILGKKDIAGQFHFEFTFDVRTLDTEFLTTVIGAVEKILPMDRMGVIDLSGLVSFLFQAIDPDLAETFIRPADQAALAETSDELQQLGMIALGIEPPLKPGGNAQMRLQVIEQAMKSPRLQQVIQSDQTGIVQKLLENQVSKHQFQIQQFQNNAQIGRTGVKPVLPGGDGTGMPAGIGMEGGQQ